MEQEYDELPCPEVHLIAQIEYYWPVGFCPLYKEWKSPQNYCEQPKIMRVYFENIVLHTYTIRVILDTDLQLNIEGR